MADKLQVDMIVKSVTDGFDKTRKSLTELNSAFSLIQRGAQFASKAYDFLIADTVKYAKESKDLSIALGLTAQETQKLIQVADDYGIEQTALTGALEMAVKNGYKPSIENLAKLADETNKIADPIQRADEMVKIFGKGWTTLVPMLNAGGDAMREGAAEAEKMGLILSDVAMSDMEEMRKKLDDAGDRIEGLKTKIASALVPALVDIGESAMKVTDNISLMADEESLLKNNVVLATVIFGEHSTQVRDASQALIDYYNNLARLRNINQGVVQGIVDENKALMMNGDANVWARAGVTQTTQAKGDGRAASEELVSAILAEEAGMRRAADAAHALAVDGYEMLKVAMAGLIENEMESFNLKQDSLSAKAAELEEKIRTSYGSAKQAAIDDLGAVKAELDTNAAAHEEATRRIVFGYAEQQLAIGGLTDKEMAALDALAVKWNLKSQEDIDAMNRVKSAADLLAKDGSIDSFVTNVEGGMSSAQQKFDDTALAQQRMHDQTIPLATQTNTTTFAETVKQDMDITSQAMLDASTQAMILQEKIDALQSKEITVTTNYVTNGMAPSGPGFAQGGSFIVPPGFPNDGFPIRVSSGEGVTITPANQMNNNFNNTINAAPGMDINALASKVSQRIARQLRASSATR